MKIVSEETKVCLGYENFQHFQIFRICNHDCSKERGNKDWIFQASVPMISGANQEVREAGNIIIVSVFRSIIKSFSKNHNTLFHFSKLNDIATLFELNYLFIVFSNKPDNNFYFLCCVGILACSQQL